MARNLCSKAMDSRTGRETLYLSVLVEGRQPIAQHLAAKLLDERVVVERRLALLQQAAKPLEPRFAAQPRFLFDFVAPVCGSAKPGLAVHLGGADLKLDRLVRQVGQGIKADVQRAVSIGLGIRDIVVKGSRNRAKTRVQQLEYALAFCLRGHDHAQADPIQDRFQLAVETAHLAV